MKGGTDIHQRFSSYFWDLHKYLWYKYKYDRIKIAEGDLFTELFDVPDLKLDSHLHPNTQVTV